MNRTLRPALEHRRHAQSIAIAIYCISLVGSGNSAVEGDQHNGKVKPDATTKTALSSSIDPIVIGYR